MIKVFSKKKLHFFLLSFLMLLQSCAHSDLSRDAAMGIDNATQDHSTYPGQIAPDEGYESSTQAMRGVLIGGTTGAVLGGLSTVGLVPGIAGGIVVGGALGAYIDRHANLIDRLRNREVKIIILGDQVLIVMPSHYLFYGQTATLRPTAYETLDMVSQFIGGFTSMLVKVIAYTNPVGSPRVNCAISQLQADAVVKYLWRRCVNTRLIVGIGGDGANSISRPHRLWDGGDNYRVEISLENLPI